MRKTCSRGPKAKPSTNKVMPSTTTFFETSNSSATSASVAENTLLLKDTTKVIKVVVTTIAHLRAVDQFIGRPGSFSSSQSTMVEMEVEESMNSECFAVSVIIVWLCKCIAGEVHVLLWHLYIDLFVLPHSLFPSLANKTLFATRPCILTMAWRSPVCCRILPKLKSIKILEGEVALSPVPQRIGWMNPVFLARARARSSSFTLDFTNRKNGPGK